MGFVRLMLVVCLFVASGTSDEVDKPIAQLEVEARDLLNALTKELSQKTTYFSEVTWKYVTNITDANLKVKKEVAEDFAKLAKEIGIKLKKYPYQQFTDSDLKRQFKKLTKLQHYALPDDKFKEYLDATSKMEANYAKLRVCSFNDPNKCDLQLEPEITEILATSRNESERRHYWLQWYNNVGPKIRDSFQKYIDLSKEAAVLNGFDTWADLWLDEYEVADFEPQIERVMEQLRPLYEQLHGYVRAKLRKYYGNDIVSERGPIPMHLLGDMWGQTWDEVVDITAPYPGKATLDVTEEMVRQKYTPLRMFQMADEFFYSLNMSKVPDSFWEKSIIEKPSDGRDLVCHASAWDFYDKDVRIKQCTRIRMEDFFTVHHELGHIQYYLQYFDQPFVYRRGANPGFHEAVGDVLSLSVSSPKHLQKIGLLKDYQPDEEAHVNQYFKAGLNKLAFIPTAYVFDKYRWDIFRGKTRPEDYNCAFWDLKVRHTGVEPPVRRSEADFDAPAKYHISANVEYLRYLVSYVIQFQFHKAVCEKAGEYVPGDPEKTLNNCDIYQSAAAGNAFKQMLQLGSSKPWPDAMEVLTGQREMDASALLEYFKPLSDFLTKYNQENNIPIGWEPSNKLDCPQNS